MAASPVSALTLITAAMQDIGVLAQGEVPDAALGQDGLRRLNAMVDGWTNQTLTIPFVTRQVFPLVAGKGGPAWPYTMGTGGDFDVPRPTSLTGAGLILAPGWTPQTVSSLTRSGTTATATVTAHGYSTGFVIIMAGASPEGYNGQVTVTVVDANTFTYAVPSTLTTPATGTITATSTASGDPVEVPRAIITDDAFQANQVKNLTNSQSTIVYFNQTYPLATIILWPVPDTTVNSLALYWNAQVAQFANLSTSYYFPPGYPEALEFNLAVRLCTPAYGRTIDPSILQLARESLAWVKRTNTKLSDLPTDPAITHDRRGGYNILTGTGG